MLSPWARPVSQAACRAADVDAMDRPTLDYYAAHSRELAARYGAVAGGVSGYFDEAFTGFHRVLDAGCGTGRDLVRLLRRGHDAAGADACPEMLDIARKACREAGFDDAGRVLPDALPHLASFPDASCDGVLCSAVLMHLPDEQLFDAVYALRRILRPGGRLLLSIPARRSDVDPETRRDAHGRYFADLPPARPEANNAKRDRLPTQRLLHHRCDAVIA
jgi:SAM-dependent methyltransferase